MKQLLFLVILTITIIGIKSSIDYSSPEYLSFVEAIKKYMNNQSHPCDDFYEYSCGNWEKHNAIPGDEETWDTYSILQGEVTKRIKEMFNDRAGLDNTTRAFRKARKLYRSCTNLESIEKHGYRLLLHSLNGTRGWPIIMAADDWTPSDSDFRLLHALYERSYSLESFYSFKISESSKNSSVSHLHLSIPSASDLMMIAESYLRNSSETTQMIGNLTEIVKILVNETGNNVDLKNVTKDINDVVDFIYDLTELVNEEEEGEEISMIYKDFLELYNNHSHSNNSKIIARNTFRFHLELTETELADNDTIDIKNLNYLLNLTKLLDSTPLRTLVNYVQLNFILKFIEGTPKRLRDVAFKLKQIISDVKTEPEREKMCIDWLSEDLAVNHEYARRYANTNSISLVNEMFLKIFAAANEILKGTPWLSRDEAEFINQKLSLMKRYISHPDWYENPSDVNKEYPKYETTKYYFKNMIQVEYYKNKGALSGLREIIDRDGMDSNPTEVNAGYYTGTNSIDITLGLLQPPFFSPNYPRIFQYAALGEIIGHEISHAFDGDGIQYDAYGNKRPWCSNTTLEVLNSKVECFVEQFDEYEMYDAENETIYVNGASTRDENIADLYGLKIAYKAYKNLNISDNITLPGLEEFTADQIFFLAHSMVQCGSEKLSYLRGDAEQAEHAIYKYRINGCVANMEEFSTAFHCPVNSTMNPSTKCSIWGSNN